MDVAAALQLLAEESAQLDSLIAGLNRAQWSTPTPAVGWNIADQVGHLLWADTVSVQTLRHDPAFDELLTRLSAASTSAASLVDSEAHERGSWDPARLLAEWRAGRTELAEALAAADEGAQITWFGPPMRPITMTTARIMETWAHGLDVFDALGVTKPETQALAAVARIGVRTREFAFRSRHLDVPVAQPRVELTMPGGGLLTFGPEHAAERVSGSAWGFAAVVTQRRNIADVNLTAEGEGASAWMSIAQAFVGEPSEGPKPGERVLP